MPMRTLLVDAMSEKGGEGGRTGRKLILDANPQKVEDLINNLRLGLYVNQACELTGISLSSYYGWKAKAEEIEERDDDNPIPADQLFLDFLDAVKKARATAEAYHLRNVRDAGETSWQASAWWLERSAPERWGRRERVEVVGKDEGPLRIQIEFGD